MLRQGTGLTSFVAIIVFFIVTVQGFVNSPKIITKDGNLIFEAGFNRNISFRLTGKSRLNINDELDLMDLLLIFTNKNRTNGPQDEWTTSRDDASLRQLTDDLNDLRRRAFGRNGLSVRVANLQNSTRTSTVTQRRVTTRLRNLDRQVNRITVLLEQDSCKSNPCENAGSCINTYNGFACRCTAGFEGTKCERDVNECALYEGTDLGCQNGAQCVNQFGTFSCICTPGWYGVHCIQRKGDCLQASTWELCGHGTCVNSNDTFGYKCLCEPGWKSNGLTPACTVDVDECSAEQHTHCTTKCINLPGSFTCAPCAAGLTGNGVTCQDVDECAFNNGGCSLSPRVHCLNTFGSYHCGDCPVGWIGDGRTCTRTSTGSDDIQGGSGTGAGGGNSALIGQSCAQMSGICHPSAICSEVSNTVVCSCPVGMVGSGIGMNGCIRGTANNCNSLPCLNGGTCLDEGANYTCMCPMGYKPPICEPIASPCQPNPCQNGARCRRMGGTRFICLCAPGYRDRLCSTRFSRCGGMLVGDTGRLLYPPDGTGYEHNAQCAWVIRTNESQVLNVTFNAFELEEATECRFDWLQINDGRTAASQFIGRFCGRHKPQGGNIISSTNELYLWFRSDNSTSKEGFDLVWNSIAPQCGGVLEVTTHGTIASPGSPGNYPKNRDCHWQLRAANNQRIKLTFFSLQIENHDSCNFDYVEIIDSISGHSLNKFCNSTNPAPMLLFTNEADVHFHSDSVGTDTGFQIHYSVEERIPGCGGTYTAREGIIASPTTNAGGQVLSCEYDIKMAIGESISIEFIEFEFELEDCIELYDVDVTRNGVRELQMKHCGSYGDKPTFFYSLYNVLQIKFHSSGKSRFRLKYGMHCAYTYSSSKQTIVSPGYGNMSNTELWCTYKILTEPNTIIQLKTLDFDMNDSTLLSDDNNDTDCSYTYITINDGIDQNIQGPFCKKSMPPTEFLSKTNMLVINYKVSSTSFGRGFKIEYNSVKLSLDGCGGVYTKSGQTIRLPTNDDGVYANDLVCYWIIMAPINKAIMVNWKSFELEDSTDCTYDYLEVYDTFATNDNVKPLGRYCNGRRPSDFITHSRQLKLKFVSDYGEAAEGFELSYEFVDHSKCGGKILASTGRITTPDFPLNYTNGVDCRWEIAGPINSKIELQIEMFELEATAGCTGDWLLVRNGGLNTSAAIGRFCGTSVPRRIPSFTNELGVEFHSDSFVNARGFRISWRVYANGCGGRINAESGVITSPLYPNPYPNDIQCEWHVIVHKGSSIHFTVEDLSLEGISECYYDYLEFYEGTRVSNHPMAHVCRTEDSEPLHIATEKNQATIVFVTDTTSNDRGFRLSFNTNCTRTLTEHTGAIESLNYGELNYDHTLNCSWTIRAPKSNRIVLEFTHFELLQPDLLSKEAIYLIETLNNGSQVTHTLTEPKNFESIYPLTIVHNTSAISFRLEYNTIGCIYALHKDSGQLQTPDYPKMYANDMECFWQITTDPGKGIELTVDDLDIEGTTNCTNDALIISSHPIEYNNHERHCGKMSNLVITSSSHKMYVRFISDHSINGKGFNASYRIVQSSCGGVLIAKNGVIKSPNYPQPYPRNADCEWTIEVSPHHGIVFDIDELDIESGYSCSWDYLEANENSQELFKVCGGEPEITHWQTKSNTATLHFVSDDSNQNKGFKLHFREACGETVTIDETDYRFFEFSRHTPTNETCTWHLIASDPNKQIIFTTTHIHMHPNAIGLYPTESDCLQNGVKIYDGAEVKGNPKLKFCKSHPPALISKSNALTITVDTNTIMDFEGNYMTMDTVCGSTYNSISGKFTTPYYPDSYPVNLECIWYIEASVGNSVALTFESMDLEQSDDCNNDYVEIRENDVRGKLLGVFCGSQLPPAMKSKQSLWLKFKSNDDIVGEGFMASYNYEKHNEINGTNGVIQSPHYPNKLHATEPYSWRITVDKDYVVLLTVKHVIDIDIPSIKFYDGYSDIGAEIDYASTKIVRSNTHILFIKALRGPFEFEWERLSKEAVRSNQTAEQNSKVCGKQLVTVDNTIVFNSPGYPHGYAANMDCSWLFVPADPAVHAVLQFVRIDIEKFAECYVDYVRVSAGKDLRTWQLLDKLCEKPNTTVATNYKGTPYLKLDFVTDSTANNTGFSTIVQTECGSELTERQGLVNITAIMMRSRRGSFDCLWTIRARQGRRIRITFLESSFVDPAETTSQSSYCRSYFLVRNGFAEDSPFLGKGKYCENNITDLLETTSNHAYIRFKYMSFFKYRATFRYEEITNDCFDVIALNEDTISGNSAIIKTPNHPNIPNPHSECVWRITAPAHHIISVSFNGQFDLSPGSGPLVDACDREYVQINDGNTELMPRLGRYCGKQTPDTIYSSGNTLRLKYFNDVSEPRLGFVATVAIGRCGGTYYSNEGTISTPQKINLPDDIRSFECVYTIEVEKGSTIRLHFEKVELPHNRNCSEVQHLELQEIDAFSDDGEEKVTDTLLVCGTEQRLFTVETNKIIIRYKMLGRSHTDGDGFTASYKAIGARCGEEIEAEQGILQTPSYPSGVTRPTHCVWYLKVPKGQRIKLEVLDFDTGSNENGPMRTFRGRITFANDRKMSSIIGRYSDTPPSAIYSTDNIMGIDVFLLPFNRHRGIKMRFSMDGDSECSYKQMGNGNFTFKQINNQTTHCTYDLAVNDNETLTMEILKFERSGLMNNAYVCSALSPLKLTLQDVRLLPSLLCNPNDTIPMVRLPFSTQMEVTIQKRILFGEVEVSFNRYNCGGIRTLYLSDNMTITQPDMDTDFGNKPLECAWAIWPPFYRDGNTDELSDLVLGVQIEINLNVNLMGNCSDRYLILYNGPDQNSPHLGRYCSQATAVNLVAERGLFLEYHTSGYERNSTFTLNVKHGSGCGGKITYPYRDIIFSEQYTDNVECVWDIETEEGFHIGLTFDDRFYIETSPNCTKDYLRVQQKSLSGDTWLDLATLCGRVPPASVNTNTTAMRLIFRSDEAVRGDGFIAKFQRNCGGTVYATKQPALIASPGYPKKYEKNLMCNYTIKPLEASAGVLVRFIDFDLEQPPGRQCLFDNVTVRTTDVDDVEHETVLCGVKSNHEYRAKKAITIIFRTDSSYSAKGFQFEYSTNVCGGEITESGVVESPRQHTDNKFPPRSNCFWNLTAPVGSKILIKFEVVDFESLYSCTYDAVEVFRGLVPLESERLAKLCGNLTGRLPTITIPTHRGLIHSYSDERDDSVGFSAFVSFVPNCDMKIYLNQRNATYTFDKYAGSYNNNLDCSYEFKTDSDRQLQIEFNSFHMELRNKCLSDYLEIRDGAGPFAELIGKFCGHDIPPKLVSSRNALYVRIVTDGSITDTGFAAVITAVPLACGKHGIKLEDKTSFYVLTSPHNVDENAQNTYSCYWKIVGNKNIHLHFTLLNLPPPDANGDCGTSYLRIYTKESASLIDSGFSSATIFNGHTQSPEYKGAAVQNIYCGSGLPSDYYANSNEVYVRYRTENSTSKHGFSLKATQAEGCFRNFTALQGRIKITDSIDQCDIYITVPANYTLSLYYDTTVFSTFNCDEEHIEIFDMHTNKTLQKICSYMESSRSLFSDTNELRLHIKSTGAYTTFDITYLASRDGPGCGGDLYNTEGLIVNPYYPRNVRNNSDCRWNIRVPVNNRVLLRFEEFNLGVKSTCNSDYLQIIERNDDGIEHVVRQFCGEDTPKLYESSRAALSVRFHKTVNYDGTGWVLKFLGVAGDEDLAQYSERITDYY